MQDVINEITKQAFQLRGSLFTLSVIQLQDTDLKAIDKQLRELVYQAPKFFQHAPVVLDLQQLNDDSSDIDFAALKQALTSHGLIPVGVRGGTQAHHEAAIKQQLAILSVSKTEEPTLATKPKQAVEDKAEQKKAKVTPKKKTKTTTNTAAATKIIAAPVRSGQQVYAKGGDLIVIGSVSQGAELLADGSIHVYGPLRGRALAGINGNTEARIFCHNMDAELVSIAGRYIVNETLINKSEDKPQQVFLENGKLQISLL